MPPFSFLSVFCNQLIRFTCDLSYWLALTWPFHSLRLSSLKVTICSPEYSPPPVKIAVVQNTQYFKFYTHRKSMYHSSHFSPSPCDPLPVQFQPVAAMVVMPVISNSVCCVSRNADLCFSHKKIKRYLNVWQSFSEFTNALTSKFDPRFPRLNQITWSVTAYVAEFELAPWHLLCQTR